jgi:hypothetical protein
MRKSLIISGVIIFCALIIYLVANEFYLQARKNAEAATSTTSPSSDINVPIGSIFAGSSTGLQNIVNTSTGMVISIKNAFFNAPNGSGDLYVNRKNVGTIDLGDGGISLASFSPDNKYFSFRVISTLGATDASFELYAVNLINGTLINIKSPQNPADFSGHKTSTESVIPVISSYTWNGDSLNIIFYFATDSSANKFYRISPVEVWNYNLNTRSYTLVQNISSTSAVTNE